MSGKALYLMCTLAFLAVFCSAGFSSGKHEDEKKIQDKPKPEGMKEISWQKSAAGKGVTIIPGSLSADFGRFNFQWNVSVDGKADLVTLEPAGSAELPLIEKKILLLVLENGSTLLFLERFPLSNAKEPYTIRLIAAVSSDKLFSVLPAGKLPPASTPAKEASLIRWGQVSQKKGAQYSAGSLAAFFGTLNIYWKKEAGHVPELITVEAPGAGELPPVEVRLIPWIDETAGTTAICQERLSQFDQGVTSYLWCLATVKTDDLMAGFNRLIQ